MYRHCQTIGLIVLLHASVVRAEGNDAEKILEAKGLRKLSSSFALPEETELTGNIREGESIKRNLFDAQQEFARCKQRVVDKRKLIVSYLQKRRELRAQLAQARTVEAHNQIVNALNELLDRILLLDQSKAEEEAMKAALAEVNRLTEHFIEHLLKTRQLYDQVVERYKQLSADSTVTQAIEQYNKTSDRTYSLGPSPSFLSYGQRLKKLEYSVLSDSIQLHRGPGDLWHLKVVFNDKNATDMAVDTGASIIALPWRTAQEVGLKPDEDDQTVQLQMADGRVVEGKLVIAEKIRVGRFTVENVECAVMPPQLTEAYPFLGLNFFKHFTFKIDNKEGKLVLAKVDDAEASGRPRVPRR